ncbi:hypothetical protein HELRODRAFT_176391 [Helobdella robusta]|uniref:Cystatin domain-containing protein n=1 Tax=Helobdella robusta TaxID=6412 RepID=T1FAH0_HELRO|nr:hypothetical protein HELRODRAFT_176391 [Helobdella robusta]ESO00081.1 hypothetical protein HELRODRAFT_176391 [Helobdella robusta]
MKKALLLALVFTCVVALAKEDSDQPIAVEGAPEEPITEEPNPEEPIPDEGEDEDGGDIDLPVAEVGEIHVTGGWSSVSEKYLQDMRKYAERSLELFDDSETGGLAQRIQKIKSASTQVVNGFNYKLVMDVGLLNCKEEEASRDDNACKSAECTFILYQPWPNIEPSRLSFASCESFQDVLQMG